MSCNKLCASRNKYWLLNPGQDMMYSAAAAQYGWYESASTMKDRFSTGFAGAHEKRQMYPAEATGAPVAPAIRDRRCVSDLV